MENEIQPSVEKTSRAEKIFLLVFVLLIVGSIGVTYWKIIIKRDYVIVAQSDCDPYTENCFVHVCDPDPNVDGSDACKGNPTDDTWFTKNMHRMAYNIPNCDPADEKCTALVCADGESNCSYELCDASNVPSGDSCNDPVQYTKDNPPTDESAAECDPATEDCSADSADATVDEKTTAAPCDSTTGDVCPLNTSEDANAETE
jgi:hypothetical protein